MADASKYFAIRRATLTAGSWTAVPACPISCSRVVIENGSPSVDMSFRTDQGNGLTEKTIPAGQELDIAGRDECFDPGTVVGYVLVSSGSGPVIVSYAR